uniref:Aldehyde dehydrogenase n=1 Tax=Panagrellus redivivus TaxID=6233 RepID=A0A7E4UN17_PANRE
MSIESALRNAGGHGQRFALGPTTLWPGHKSIYSQFASVLSTMSTSSAPSESLNNDVSKMANDPASIVKKLRDTFDDGVLETVEKRKKELQAFERMVVENADAFADAMWKDLHKPPAESHAHEIDFLVGEIQQTLSNLKCWTAPTKVTRYVLQALDSAYILKEPLGVVLVIGAWNFPVRLLLSPVVGAIAAGNTVVIKPSEISSHTSHLVALLVPEYLSEGVATVVEGGPAETTELLKQRFDHIFYTGNPAVGKIVMRAAAEHLTPVTLELGGKNPVIIDETADLATTARRLVWGKFTNAGQVCVACDYVLNLHPDKEAFMKYVAEAITEFYGIVPKDSPDFGRIVSKRHFDRLIALLSATSGTVAIGGNSDESTLFVGPTVVTKVSEDDALMKEELFGPIMPVIDLETLDQAISFIRKREKPLALYVFSNKTKNVDLVTSRTSSGAVVVNDLIMHMSLETLPFGGVGQSGMGKYHGKYTFDTFTHEKSVLNRSSGFEKILFMRYPPYTESKLAWARRFLSKWRVPF